MEGRHILFLTPSFPKNEQDTTCLPYFHNYIFALRKHHPSLALSILCLEYPEESHYYWHEIPVYSLGKEKLSRWKKPILWSAVMKLGKRIHQQKPVNVIHSLWLGEIAFIGQKMARNWKVHHVNTAMGTEVYKRNLYLKRLDLDQIQLNCVSRFQAERLRKKFPDISPKVTPWGLGEVERKNEDNSLRPIDVLFVGGINPIKNFPLFLKTIKRLAIRHPSLNARVVGHNAENLDVEAMIADQGLQPYVTYMDRLSNEETLEVMKKSKVLLHTSDYEAQGYVFLEALISGMCIVSRMVGIAKPSARWMIASNLDEFVDAVSVSLQNWKGYSSEALYPIDQTVDTYIKQYAR